MLFTTLSAYKCEGSACDVVCKVLEVKARGTNVNHESSKSSVVTPRQLIAPNPFLPLGSQPARRGWIFRLAAFDWHAVKNKRGTRECKSNETAVSH